MGKFIDDSIKLRLKYQVDCVKFIEDIISPTCTPPMQLKEFHKEWIDLFNKNRFVSLLAPRSSGKTQLVGAYILWNIAKNPKIRILVVTINQEMADNIMSFIQRHLEGNSKLIEVFGQQRGYTDWSRSTLRVLGAGNQKDPTLKVLGITASMVGGHHNMIILDDIMDSNNSKTEHRRKEVINLFESTMMPMLEPKGRVISIATRWHTNDISAYLQKIPDYASRTYKAVIKYPQDNEGVAEVLWPERFPYEELMKIKDRYGSLAFEMQYQNNIVSIEDSPIKQEWVESAIDNYSTIQTPFETYMGVDLASKGEETDYFAITIVGVHEGKIWVLDGLRTKASLFRQFELIRSYDSKWQPIRIGIDQAAQQKMIVDQLIESTTLPIIPIKPSIVNDKMSRAQRLSVLFETGRIFINPQLRLWADEAIAFRASADSVDDTLDSLSFSIQAAQYKEEDTHVDWEEVASIVHDIKKESSVDSVDKWKLYKI